MIRSPVILSVLVAALLVTSSAGSLRAEPGSGPGDAILGTWLTGAEGKEMAKVTVNLEGGMYAGRIVWLQYPEFREGDEPGMEGKPKVDLKNPDPELRSRPVLGMVILNGLRYQPGKKWPWVGGSVYDPENGHTYRARLRLEEDGTLRIKGFVLIPLFGRSTNWTRVSGPENSILLIPD